MTAQPARIARAVAADLWPSVQNQQKIAAGVWWFSCAGHGGCVAVIGVAELPEIAVDVARARGKTELAIFIDYGAHHRPRTQVRTSITYTEQGLRDLAARDARVTLFELWVGEEDCDWACIFHSASALIEPAARALGWTLRADDVDGCVDRWNPEFRDALAAALAARGSDDRTADAA